PCFVMARSGLAHTRYRVAIRPWMADAASRTASRSPPRTRIALGRSAAPAARRPDGQAARLWHLRALLARRRAQTLAKRAGHTGRSQFAAPGVSEAPPRNAMPDAPFATPVGTSGACGNVRQ